MDNLGQLISRINGIIKLKGIEVQVPKSKLNVAILKFLYQSGYILGFVLEEKTVKVLLNYYKGKSQLRGLRRISTPGSRVYMKKKQLSNSHRMGKKYVLTSARQRELYWLWQAQLYEEGGEVLFELI